MANDYAYAAVDAQGRPPLAYSTDLSEELSSVDKDLKGYHSSSRETDLRSLLFRYICPLILVFLLGVAVGRLSTFLDKSPSVQGFVVPLKLQVSSQKFVEQNSFSAPPSVASDAEWSALLPEGNGWVRLQPSGRSKSSPVQKDEVFNIAAYHQLHCLNQLRAAYYKGAPVIGATNLTSPEKDPAHHFKHCIEYLRQSILCNVDTTLEPFDTQKGGTLTWGVEHECRDEQALNQWAGENRLWERHSISELPANDDSSNR